MEALVRRLNDNKINIRGIASMYASTDPLIIVDGAHYTASLSNIPQNDIESISVLKDAASASLYGARGAAGVIIVTTKEDKPRMPRSMLI
ncbi:TonB-dependent receptor plug domain-containing protein [Bacteroides stercoris]|nr:TonB-dependent receptor plug domain-containing protein [Bacteroides stercoris]